MAKQLLLMRHAKSDWPEGIDSDFARPLNARGRKAAPKMGGWIRDQGHLPDLILCSSSQRTEETVQRMVQDWSPTPPVYSSRSLYLATAEGILDVVRSDAMDAERVLVVGHNPGMENLAHHLGVHSSGFPTAALAVFQVAIDSWSELQSGSDAECIEFVRPKALLASDESDNP